MSILNAWAPIGTLVRLTLERELEPSEWEAFSVFCERTVWINTWTQGTILTYIVLELDDVQGEGMRHKIEILEQQIEDITEGVSKEELRRLIGTWRKAEKYAEGHCNPDAAATYADCIEELEGLL